MFRNILKLSKRSFATAASTSSSSSSSVPASTTELKLTFGTPNQPIYVNHSVTGLSLPSDEGYFSILPNKIPQISQLKAGLVTIHHVGGGDEKFFVSGGFAFNRTDNTADISVPEAFPLSDFDHDAIKKEWNEANRLYNAAASPEAKAEAYVQMNTIQELSRVLGVAV